METHELLLPTALTAVHKELGAKIVPFAGYEMPVQYAGVTVEHLAVRNGVGVFDVSHMGEFYVEGPEALAFLQTVTSNDVAKLVRGKIQYSCLPNTQGGIVDDLLVYCLGDNRYMLVVNASNMAKDWQWLMDHSSGFDVSLRDASAETSLLAVQGPLAVKALQPLTDVDLDTMTYYTFGIGTFAGFDDVLISATGYTGAGCFELYFPNHAAAAIWKAIFQHGASYSIAPIGLGARDTLRLEMGFCLYGNDIDDHTSPLEAGLGWITKFTKAFTNHEALKAQKEAGVTQKLVGFILIDRGVPRHDYPITDEAGVHIGRVTSGTMAPSLGKAIGLGYVPVDRSTPGSILYIEVRGKLLQAEVVSLPFWKGNKA